MSSGRGRLLPLLATSLGLLAWSNLLVPVLPGGAAVRAALNVGAAAGLVLIVRSTGSTWRELAMSRATWRSGARWGAGALAVATGGYLIALAIPAAHAALAGSAAADLPLGELAVRALLLIPLGTVVSEEVAFRGVLLALALRRFGPSPAGLFTAVVFGLWHVGTAVRGASSLVPANQSVAASLIVTTLGGVALAWLRLRSDSLLAPIGLHLGTNVVGLLATATAGR